MAAVSVSFLGPAVASWVMKASLNVGTGVFVTSRTMELVDTGVCVTAGTVGGTDVVGAPPSGVGVTYCPHKEAVCPLAHAASKNDAAVKRLISRFTNEVRCWELYLDKGDRHS